MRHIKSIDMHGVTVEEVLEEFNERATEFGIYTKDDLISISTRAVTKPHKIAIGKDLMESTVVVTFFFWAPKHE